MLQDIKFTFRDNEFPPGTFTIFGHLTSREKEKLFFNYSSCARRVQLFYISLFIATISVYTLFITPFNLQHPEYSIAFVLSSASLLFLVFLVVFFIRKKAARPFKAICLYSLWGFVALLPSLLFLLLTLASPEGHGSLALIILLAGLCALLASGLIPLASRLCVTGLLLPVLFLPYFLERHTASGDSAPLSALLPLACLGLLASLALGRTSALAARQHFLARQEAISHRQQIEQQVEERKLLEDELILLRSEMQHLVEKRTEELRTARDAAELANRSKSEFMASISHELRTPLNAIIGFSDMMRSGMFGSSDSERFRNYCTSIQESGENLLKVLNDILDVSSLDNGSMVLEEEEVDPVALLANILVIKKPQLDEAGLELDFHVSGHLPMIMADPGRLRQCLNALLSNAVKFSREDGKITVSIDRTGEGCLDIIIQDQGIGMTSAELAIAQEPFRQVDGRLERKYEGTGLGLPLATSIIDLHGGHLRIESEPEKGTKVVIRLPAFRVIPDETSEA